jgi:hypothetical protein
MVRWKPTGVSEENVASILTLTNEPSKKPTRSRTLLVVNLIHASFLLDLFFYPEDGGEILLQNASRPSANHTALSPEDRTSVRAPGLWTGEGEVRGKLLTDDRGTQGRKRINKRGNCRIMDRRQRWTIWHSESLRSAPCCLGRALHYVLSRRLWQWILLSSGMWWRLVW